MKCNLKIIVWVFLAAGTPEMLGYAWRRRNEKRSLSLAGVALFVLVVGVALSPAIAIGQDPITVIGLAPGEPNGPLTLIGSSLYGTDISGGSDGGGSVFRVNTDRH